MLKDDDAAGVLFNVMGVAVVLTNTSCVQRCATVTCTVFVITTSADGVLSESVTFVQPGGIVPAGTFCQLQLLQLL